MEKEIASAARAAEIARRQTDAKTSAERSPTPPESRPPLRSPRPAAVCRCRCREHEGANMAHPTALVARKGAFRSRPVTGAQVTAPCDGWVVFAGNFRSYGQLLIINAGGGYHVLLAGMERITVDLGQFVLTGEPVAVMGKRASDGDSRDARLLTTGTSYRVPQGREFDRLRPLVGGNRNGKGTRMMRRTSLFLLGAAAGAFAVALVVQPKLLLGQTAARRCRIPIASSTCSATSSSTCARNMSRRRTTRSWSSRPSTAC